MRERSVTKNVTNSSAIEGIWVKRDPASGRFVSTKSDSTTPFKAVRKTSR